MGIFRAAHGWGEVKKASLPKICHTYPTMMKLGTVKPYLKNYVTHPLTSADISIFHRQSANFVISRNTDIDCILVHIFYFFQFFMSLLEILLIKLVIILTMSAKMATPGLVKITVL